MDNIAIENFAVNAVKDCIFTSELLSPFISDNDKEPSWDGNVYIYKNKRKRADDIIGRVPVQVKGTEKDVLTKKEISFQMEISALNNFLKVGGTMLFVVYVQNPDKGKQRKIYYAALTPVALRALIPANKVKGKKSVRLKEFPSDKGKIADIFLNFYEDVKRQDSFSNAKLQTIEELKQSGQLEGLDIYVSTFGNDSPEDVVLNNDVYLYARMKGCAIPQPIDVLVSEMSVTRVVKASVTVGENELYTEYRVTKRKDNVSIQIGSSLSMIFPKNGELPSMNYKEAKTLRALAKDLEFILLYMDTGKFYIGEKCFLFDYENVDQSNFDVEKQKARLEYLKEVVEVLDSLGYHGDLDLCKLTPEDDRNLRFLVTTLVEKKHKKNLGFKTPRVVKMKVADISFAIYIEPCGDEEYGIYDFFRTELQVAYEFDGEEKLPISQYALLNADDMCKLTNLRAEVFLPSFQKQPRHKDTMNRANLFLLELLKAYDMSVQKRQDLLDSAISFAEWIQTADDSELDKRIRRLNYLQTIKRKGAVNDIEKEELYSMAEDESCLEDCKTAAYLLLDIQPLAQRHFNRMPEQEQRAFREFPIYHFWKES
ncbi:MAG: DUF4365 domain-containing protein [Oscillospiraceae bacterium]|nr:DUF4365 domain-containing protein [Oscillospiraceae bacterium]